jgi:hypothetical protein
MHAAIVGADLHKYLIARCGICRHQAAGLVWRARTSPSAFAVPNRDIAAAMVNSLHPADALPAFSAPRRVAPRAKPSIQTFVSLR